MKNFREDEGNFYQKNWWIGMVFRQVFLYFNT